MKHQNAYVFEDIVPRQQVHEISMFMYIICIYIYINRFFGMNRSLDMHGACWVSRRLTEQSRGAWTVDLPDKESPVGPRA